MSDPELRIGTDDGELTATRDNASLFMHLGEDALYDHVFIVDDEKEAGFYIFRYNAAFPAIAKHMRKNHYPLHMNIRGAAECDKKAYDKAVDRMTREVDNWTIPDDWVDGK